MSPSDTLLLTLAMVVEYQLRGERDKGLERLRGDLNRAIWNLANTKEPKNEQPT